MPDARVGVVPHAYLDGHEEARVEEQPRAHNQHPCPHTVRDAGGPIPARQGWEEARVEEQPRAHHQHPCPPKQPRSAVLCRRAPCPQRIVQRCTALSPSPHSEPYRSTIAQHSAAPHGRSDRAGRASDMDGAGGGPCMKGDRGWISLHTHAHTHTHTHTHPPHPIQPCPPPSPPHHSSCP